MADPSTPPVAAVPRAVLFDIDGTLAVGSSAHLTALLTVVRRDLGVDADVEVVDERPRIAGVDVTGWIDAQVLRMLLRRARRATDGPTLARLVDHYAQEYGHTLTSGALSAGTAVPGAREALDRLVGHGIPAGLVTGNTHAVARRKLSLLGLAHPFAFTPDGGFGDRRASRTELPGAALHLLGVPPGSDVWLVGDAMADMAAASGAGLTAVGVLTGADDEAALREAGAVWVLGSVADLPLGPPPGRSSSGTEPIPFA